MSRDDWFRNTDWNADIEARFFEKLRRARDKAQYLRIQASYLEERHPRASLALLDKYFALGDRSQLSLALVTAAQANLALGRTEEAIRLLKTALERDRSCRNSHSTAWRVFVELVATQSIEPEFEEALRVLAEHESDFFLFPLHTFEWHAAKALILAAQGKKQDARQYAQVALEAARKVHSGVSRHPHVGLVGGRYEGIKDRLIVLTGEYC